MNTRSLKIYSIALLVVVSLSGFIPVLAQEAGTPEIARLKAAFVFNFSKYFTWPEDEKWVETDNFNVCIDSSPVVKNAFLALNNQETQGREIRVVDLSVNNVDIMSFCHIWYVGGGRLDSNLAKLNSLENDGVLTVSDYPGFNARGGIVELLLVDNKLRFKINTAIAQREQLSISSRLLSLALTED